MPLIYGNGNGNNGSAHVLQSLLNVLALGTKQKR